MVLSRTGRRPLARTGRRRRLFAAIVFAVALGLGTPSVALAAGPVLAAIPLPAGEIAQNEVAVGSDVWTLSTDAQTGYLFRIDSATNTVTGRIDLPPGSPGGNFSYQGALAYAFGSLWVAESFRDQVFRIDPATGAVIARISTGRYPVMLAAGAGAVWVAQAEGGSVVRIDPSRNRVTATVLVGDQRRGKDQPAAVTYDPYTDQVLTTLPSTHRVAAIDATTLAVDTFSVAPAFACGRAVARPDGFWLDDSPCSSDMFRWDSAAGHVAVDISLDPRDTSDYGIAVRGDVLYTGERTCGGAGCRGEIVKRDGRSGVVLARVRTPSDGAFLPELAAGDLWVSSFGTAVLVHLRAF